MAKPGVKGMQRILNATKYSKQGVVAAWRNEAAFRQELTLALVLFPLGIWLGTSALEHIVLIGSLILVLIVELLNSAIEAVVDRIGDEFHALSGQAKDMGSAAVFLSLILVPFVWGLVALERFAGT